MYSRSRVTDKWTHGKRSWDGRLNTSHFPLLARCSCKYGHLCSDSQGVMLQEMLSAQWRGVTVSLTQLLLWGSAVFFSVVDVWPGFCYNSAAGELKDVLSSPAELPADWKHYPEMAGPQRTAAAAAGALWSAGTPRMSRNVHVRDGLESEAVPPPGRGTARGRSGFTTLPNQCKHRSTVPPGMSSQDEEKWCLAWGWCWVFHSDIYKDGRHIPTFALQRSQNNPDMCAVILCGWCHFSPSVWLELAGGGIRMFKSPIFIFQSVVFHAFIHSLHLSMSMLNLVWPLSRLGGVLWGRLLPPSLPSPLPCPGRGMRDLEGLSTEVPLGSEAAPRGRRRPSLLSPSWPASLELLVWPVWPACLHAPQCLCFSSAIWTTPAFCPLRAALALLSISCDDDVM